MIIVGRSPAPRSQVLVRSLAFGSLPHCGLVRYPTQRGAPRNAPWIEADFCIYFLRAFMSAAVRPKFVFNEVFAPELINNS